jgi:hypothetical protein
MYKQPVILFGIVTPLVIAAMIIGASTVIRGKVVSSYEKKANQYKTYQASKLMALENETLISRQRKVYQQWLEILEQEPFALLTTNLRVIGESLPPKEFQLTSSERINNNTGFGNATSQKSSNLNFNIRGTYRTVQKALLELETSMPNLQLQDLRVGPNGGSDTSLLNFQVTYTAWEK